LVSATRRGWRYRANIVGRAAAAVLGGYALAALFAAATARLLPLPRVEAVLPGTMLAFVVIPAVAIWAFLARSVARAWAGIVIAAMLLAAATWLAGLRP
jgi:hypothetical protein